MNDCLDTDAIITIGNAVLWDVTGALHHLETCADCRARVAALRSVHAAFHQTIPVDETTLARISDALRERSGKQRHVRFPDTWISALEGGLGGIAGLVILLSSRIPIASVEAGALTFAAGVAVALIGRSLRPPRWVAVGESNGPDLQA